MHELATKTKRLGLLFALCVAGHTPAMHAEEIPAPLRGVQRLVFLGDSITQAGDYVTDFDCWLVSRGISIEVLNLGLASETGSDLTETENAGHKSAYGFGRPMLSERLARVLAMAKPDLLIACYGMNDGSSLAADETGTKRFAAAITHLRDAALQAGVRRVVLCTPPPHDAKGDASQKTHDENLTRYSEWLLSKRADGWDVVDIHGPMLKALTAGRMKDPGFALAGDGVHPGREGHWLMASAILTQFVGVNLAGTASAEQLFKTDGKQIRELVRQRLATLFDAWMTRIGHTRPGVPGAPGANPGPTIPEANAKVLAITKQLADLQAKAADTKSP